MTKKLDGGLILLLRREYSICLVLPGLQNNQSSVDRCIIYLQNISQVWKMQEQRVETCTVYKYRVKKESIGFLKGKKRPHIYCTVRCAFCLTIQPWLTVWCEAPLYSHGLWSDPICSPGHRLEWMALVHNWVLWMRSSCPGILSHSIMRRCLTRPGACSTYCKILHSL
jgi:hypothetical protein